MGAPIPRQLRRQPITLVFRKPYENEANWSKREGSLPLLSPKIQHWSTLLLRDSDKQSKIDFVLIYILFSFYPGVLISATECGNIGNILVRELVLVSGK